MFLNASKNFLMNGIARGPEGLGGAGELDPFGRQATDFQSDENSGGLDESEDITLDEPDILDTLFEEEEPDANAKPPVDPNEPKFPTQQEITDELTAAIEGFNLPEDIIPADFNANDPVQLRALMADVGRHAIQSSLATMFRPIETAMRQQEHRVTKLIKESVKGGIDGDKEEQTILSVIPAYGDPAMKKTVRMMYDQAKTKHKDPAQAARVTKQALLSMGVNPAGRKTQIRSASANMLDSYAALPKLDPQRRPTQQAQDALRRKP